MKLYFIDARSGDLQDNSIQLKFWAKSADEVQSPIKSWLDIIFDPSLLRAQRTVVEQIISLSQKENYGQRFEENQFVF